MIEGTCRIKGDYKSTKPRDKTLDIVKGIGIILVVVGHSGTPLEHFISLFHMAIFFMASGYCWNERCAKDIVSAKGFIIRRLKTLWFPFALCNSIFSICHNFFLWMGIYTSDEKILLSYPRMYEYLSVYKTPHETIQSVVKNLLFAGDTQLGGAMWFLRTLFVVSLVHLLLRYFANHWKYGKYMYRIAVMVTIVAAAIVTDYNIRLPMGIHTCFAAYIAFLGGVVLRKTNLAKKTEASFWVVLICSMSILLVAATLGSISMNEGRITNVFFFTIVSLAGWYLIWIISSRIKGIFADILVYCGQHSIWIVMLHFLAFKPVSLLYQWITRSPSYTLAIFPAIEDCGILWLAYVLNGVLLPLLVVSVLNRFLRCVCKIGRKEVK